MADKLLGAGAASTVARATAAALAVRAIRTTMSAAVRTVEAAGEAAAVSHGGEDPVHLACRDVAYAGRMFVETIDGASRSADSSLLEELHEAAAFAADATQSFSGTHHMRRMVQQAQEFAHRGMQQAGDAAARIAQTTGLDSTAVAGAVQAVYLRRQERLRDEGGCKGCRVRCSRRMRSCCFRFWLWRRRVCTC